MRSVPLAISFVIPWFSESGTAGGGAEMLCRQYAARLARSGHDVEVLTTCSRDHDADWYRDELPSGRTITPDGYAVERFAVRRGNRNRFLDLNQRILHRSFLAFREEREFLDNSIQSDGLAQAVADRAATRIVVALPYLFGIVWRALVENPGRILLWPCLHDEGYARLKLIAEGVFRARALIYNTPTEADLARSLYAPSQPHAVVGMGVDVPPQEELDGEMKREDYLVYVGRLSTEKGLPHLAAAFPRLRATAPRPVRLLLAGKGEGWHDPSAGIHNLGFVPEEKKWALLRKATLFVLPSVHESFSISLLEALACATPVVVRGGCAVTRRHVEQGQCGLWYDTEEELIEAVLLLLDDPDLARQLGAQGRAYVLGEYAWEKRLALLVEFLKTLG